IVTPTRESWPTLAHLRDKGQRVMVFMSDLAGEPWMLPAYYPGGGITMNDYEANTPTNQDDNLRPCEGAGFFFSDRTPGDDITDGYLYLLNNQYTDDLIRGKWTQASRAYCVWTVGDLLIENTIRAWRITGKKPNFINVDYYQGVLGVHS